jgi:hypothetical protein
MDNTGKRVCTRYVRVVHSCHENGKDVNEITFKITLEDLHPFVNLLKPSGNFTYDQV